MASSSHQNDGNGYEKSFDECIDGIKNIKLPKSASNSAPPHSNQRQTNNTRRTPNYSRNFNSQDSKNYHHSSYRNNDSSSRSHRGEQNFSRNQNFNSNAFNNGSRQNRGNKCLSNRRSHNEKVKAWKLFRLRGSCSDDQIVEFRKHLDACYGTDGDEIIYYTPYISQFQNDDRKEIREFSAIFQQWIDNVMTECIDPSDMDQMFIKVCYGCFYITNLEPYVDRMSHQQLKQHLNWMSPSANSSNPKRKRICRIKTAFFPIYNKYPCKYDSLDKSSSLVLDEEWETFRISFVTQDSKIRSYIDYDSQMNLISSKEDIAYLKLDIKDPTGGNDVRISIAKNNSECTEALLAQRLNTITDESPLIKLEETSGAVIVEKACTKRISNVRHKKIKTLKFAANAELWDELRMATVINVSKIAEYLQLDRKTGKFNEIHEKLEVNLGIQLSSIFRREYCELRATVLPAYLRDN
ncbi:hypothetical protein TrispH2_009658 [Trichoplax sp. H2]|nr:hypothetical protein TrispH2_009658 [Trichoplax sp. H2]|eukprot:RDD38489.1 hypothetical protein TrispH2_009658 [Trichoplax sp. H2]